MRWYVAANLQILKRILFGKRGKGWKRNRVLFLVSFRTYIWIIEAYSGRRPDIIEKSSTLEVMDVASRAI